jgi:hypothetical protein
VSDPTVSLFPRVVRPARWVLADAAFLGSPMSGPHSSCSSVMLPAGPLDRRLSGSSGCPMSGRTPDRPELADPAGWC